MKHLIIFIFLLLEQSYTCATDERYSSGQCIKNTCLDKYLQNVQADENGKIPITFHGTANWRYTYIEVIIKFPDSAIQGTMYRDNSDSCIMDQLFHYNIGFTDEFLGVYTITSNYDQNLSQRNWSFQIPLSDYRYQLDIDISSLHFATIKGYYGIKFYGGLQLSLILKFQFALEISKTTYGQFSSSFNSFVQKPIQVYNSNEKWIDYVESKIEICSEDRCSNLQLYYNQLLQISLMITSQEYLTSTLTLSSITLIGNGLSRKMIPKNITSFPNQGKLMFYIQLDIAYDQGISFQVDSKLYQNDQQVLFNSTVSNNDQETILDPIHVTQSTCYFKCIKHSKQVNGCPDCQILETYGISCLSKQLKEVESLFVNKTNPELTQSQVIQLIGYTLILFSIL